MLTLCVVLSCVLPATAQEWSGPVRGSWARQGEAKDGDINLSDDAGLKCEIVVGPAPASPVRQASEFLAGDIEKLTGHRPAITAVASGAGAAIHLVVIGDGQQIPEKVASDRLKGQWEAYHILTDDNAVWLVGSDARGAAYAAYTLSERLGIDPLHIWTGIEPTARPRLTLARTDHFVAPPTFKYRGMFHDDEDILPRPFEYSGYPLRIGDVPLEWYGRLFETALRLRMNMVAPYTRTHRRFEVQKLASDWGLFYTSHHYDILLSNPFGFKRFNLAAQRGVTGDWNWLTNRENMLKFWRGGLEENGNLYCIWPVGLRGTDDYAYPFPKEMSQEQQNQIFRQAIDAQLKMARELAPTDKPPIFHFTLYGEMLDKYLGSGGKFDMPSDVILIWPDDNDGRMRAVPKEPGNWKHGVYYHAAYYGPVAKQTAHIVPPARIADQFKRIVDSGATEYALLNVSELREFIQEARLMAEITWDAKASLSDTPSRPEDGRLLPHVPTAATQPIPPDEPSPSADRFERWWCSEYFGNSAAPDAVKAYQQYRKLLDRWDRLWLGSDKVAGAIDSLIKKFAGREFAAARADTLPMLHDRDKQYQQAFATIRQARSKMSPQQQQFFFEHVELPLFMDWRPTQAAILLIGAMAEPDRDKAWKACEEAMKPLEQLETELARAERPPFEGWYRTSWIRNEDTGLNPHRPYLQLRMFLSSGGRQRYARPDSSAKPDLPSFVPILKEHLP
jgi:hypothetical protein